MDKKYSLLSSIVSVDPDFGVGGNQLLQKHITTFYTHHGSIHFVLKHFFKEEVNQTSKFHLKLLFFIFFFSTSLCLSNIII